MRYPKQNERLYERIVERGVTVSELAPGTAVRRWSFPARNRIMAGLARLVVVVEAAEGSGSLITVDFAHQVDVDVAAVPGLVTSRMAAGSNQLLRDGAPMVRDATDVLELLFGVGAARAQPVVPELEPQLRLVLDAVEARDSLQLARQRAGLSAGALRAALGRLETLGLVCGDGLGGYERRVTSGRAT